MFEGLRSRKIATALVIGGGSIALFGCGNSVEGVGNVNMVDCSPHGTPRANSMNVAAVPSGETIQMGNEINTNAKGEFPASGDFAVTSEGSGKFSVDIGDGDGNNSDVSIIPNYSGNQNTVTVTDHGELYAISGTPGPQKTTELDVSVHCL